jgi:hypothetical protein
MNFGKALDAMKAGKKVSRAGWNGKGMWVALTPGSIIRSENARYGAAVKRADELYEAALDAWARELRDEEEPITIGAHIDMRAADGTLVIGWLASQTDMLADDWGVVE